METSDSDYSLGNVFHSEYARLKAAKEEYEVTLRVLAVVSLRLLKLTNGSAVVISDDQVANHPEITAWRDPEHGQIHIEVRE